MAVVAGINNAGLRRLKRTLAEVPRKNHEVRSRTACVFCSPLLLKQPTDCGLSLPQLFESLEKLMTSASNYKTYREAMQICPPPCVPYLYGCSTPFLSLSCAMVICGCSRLSFRGVYLQDLTFIEDGNPDFIAPPPGLYELLFLPT
jgi:hypothetical protein